MSEINKVIEEAGYLLDFQKKQLKEDLPGCLREDGREYLIDFLHHLLDMNENDLSTEESRRIDEFLSDSTD